MSDETGIKCENAEDGDNVAETDTKTDTETKEPKETKPRTVSFNRDVHVKRFGKPRESRGASAEPAVRKEPFTHLSEQELIEEANKVLAQAESVTCSTDNNPEKFYSLPHRRKYKENRDRRNSDDAGIPDKKPLGRSTSDVSGKRGKERTSLSTLFRRNQKNKSPVAPIVVAATKKPVVVKRSKSDVSDLKSNTNLNTQSKPIRKRSGSESEEFLRSLRNKKTQLSPIIESSPRDDFFKKTPPLDLFQKNKTIQKESSKSEDQTFKSDTNKVNPIEKPPRYKTPEKAEPKPPVRTKRGKSLEKDSSPSITETPKRKTDIKKTLLVDEIDNIKAKDINPVEVKERIKDSIRKLEENIYGDKEMIHSSQMPPDKPPLTRGHTVGTIVRKLKEDQLASSKSHMISSMHSSSVNQPFSYTKPSVSPDPNLFVRNTSPDRIPSPVNKMNDKGVVYAHVVRDNSDTGYSNLAKQTVHKTYSPSRDKFGNISDEDEGLGYEDRHKYPTGRYNYDYKHTENDKFPSLEGVKITDSPIRPRFREYKLTSFNDFEPTYANEYPSAQDKSHDFIETFRGRADGMDTMKKHSETDNKVDLDFDELRQRRELLESRIKSRRLEREPNVGEPISRFLAETDPIYEANKRMKATEKYVNETARYIHHTLERDGFAESSITEDYNKYDSDNHKVKYNTESRTYQKVPKVELDRREYIDRLDPRGKDIPPEPEYEPPSLEFKTRKPFLSPNEYTEKKYKMKKHYTSSHDVQAGTKYRGKDDEFGKRKGHYASNPEIAQERDDYSDIRYDPKQAETFHNSLRRLKNKDKYKEAYGIKRHDSGDSHDYRDDRSPRRFDFDSRLVDSGIENDFRKDSSEIHRRPRGHESDDDVRNTSLFLDSERRHTEDNYPSEQIYANGEYLARFKGYRDDEYRKGYPRDRSADDASHFDPKAGRYDKSPTDEKVSAKPPKAKKLSGLEKMKQLFSRDSSKKSKKEKEAVQAKTRTRVLKSPEHLGDDDEEYKRYTDPEPSDIETKKREYDLKDEDRRYRSSREDLDRHRSPRDDLDRHKSPITHMEIRRSPRDDLDRHKSPITHEIRRDPRDDLEKRKSPITHMEIRRSPRSFDRNYGSGEDGERQRSSREDLDRYRSSKEDVRYMSLDPRDSDPERKYRETDFGTRSRYEHRTTKEDRRYVERKEEKRRYTSSDRESDLQRSDAENDRRKTRSRTAGPVDSPVLAERYRERRRLATPSPRPSPTPSPPRQPATTAGNWFKSLDRLTRRKKNNVKEEKASSVLTVDEPHKWKKPLNSPAKNLRFFGDTDQDSDANSKPSTKPKSHPHHSTLRKTVSNSSTGIDEIDHELTNKSYSLTNLHKDKSESPRTKQYYKRNLHNINEVHSNSENESNLGRKASKPPINPYDRRSRSQSSSKTLKGSKGDVRRHRTEERGSSSELRGSRQELGSRELKHRRRTPANSGESSTEGESSHQSQRSVVFLHATTVGDIPDPGQLSRNRSRDDVSSVNSSNLQVRNTTKSFSIFAPWTPKHYSEQQDVHYSQRPRRPRPKEATFKKSSSTKNLTDDRPATLQKNKSYSHTTLTRKPQNHRLTSSSSTLYRKPEKRGDNSSVQSTTISRKSLGREKKSQSNEVLNRDGRDGISRSISMPKDNSKKAGWFKLTNKTKKQENTRVR